MIRRPRQSRQEEEKRPRAVQAVERHELIFTLEASARNRIKDQKKRGDSERHQKNLCRYKLRSGLGWTKPINYKTLCAVWNSKVIVTREMNCIS